MHSPWYSSHTLLTFGVSRLGQGQAQRQLVRHLSRRQSRGQRGHLGFLGRQLLFTSSTDSLHGLGLLGVLRRLQRGVTSKRRWVRNFMFRPYVFRVLNVLEGHHHLRRGVHYGGSRSSSATGRDNVHRAFLMGRGYTWEGDGHLIIEMGRSLGRRRHRGRRYTGTGHLRTTARFPQGRRRGGHYRSRHYFNGSIYRGGTRRYRGNGRRRFHSKVGTFIPQSYRIFLRRF